ncbi:MAG: hypothetical protein U5Q44_06990 [Dehalococcoidia bacterium]|nr:hypothetical protein [Dehalococcoidia bacterium]
MLILIFALIERFDLLEDEELQVPATWQERSRRISRPSPMG